VASRTPGGHNRIRREDLLRFLIDHNFPIPQELAREGKHVLVVDDERPLAETMAHALRDGGYQVSVAFDGYEAGLKMATLQPDLLVLDLIMPGLDGFSICQRVKANLAGKQTKIIAMTGFIQEGNLGKARECGADLCLEKPFQLETLKHMVAQLLGEPRTIPSTALGLERRRSLRVPAEFSVICTPVGGALASAIGPCSGKTLNVCREGLLLVLDAPITSFTLLAMQIVLGNGQVPLQVVGESRWVREERGGQSYRMGLAFVAMPTHVSEQWAGAIYAVP
jgi:CheY-like chemotaxis protein